jgi:hypothetical protein
MEEQEWRSCNVRMVRPNGATRFRASQSGVIPHEAFDLGNGAANIASLREVIVGPGRNIELRRQAIEMLMRHHGFEGVDVKVSAVPFREP